MTNRISDQPLISIIIPTYQGGALLDECLQSIITCEYTQKEVIVIDNCPERSWIKTVRDKYMSRSWIHFIYPHKNLYFANSVNLAMKTAQGNYVLIFNDDALLEKDSLTALMKPFQHSQKIAGVHPKLISPITNTIDAVGGTMDFLGYAYKQTKPQAKTLFYLNIGLYCKQILEKVGSYDKDFLIYWEDVDLSWRILLSGYRIVYEPTAIIWHKVSATTKHRPSSFNTYHVRKNRLMGLIKNYSLLTLLFSLPLLLISYLCLAISELIKTGQISLFMATVHAIGWNITHLPNTLKKRQFVQSHLRKISDEEILKKLVPLTNSF